MRHVRKCQSFPRFALLVCAPLFATLAAARAAAEPAPARLSLTDALARAETASPLVRRARAEREAVAARDVGASLLLPANPVVSAAAGPRREGDRRGTEFLLHAEQTVEIGGQRAARRAVVGRAVRTASLREEVARIETRARVRAAYVAAQLAGAQVDAAAERERLTGALLEAVRARVASGASSSVDLELARLEHGVAARARAGAALAAADLLARLRVLVGLPPGAPLQVDLAVAPPAPPAGALPALLARAEQRRAELAVLRAGGEELDAEIARLHREAIPSATLFVDFERDLPGQAYLGGGVAIPLPLWRRQQGELALAHAERARLGDEQALAAREVALEVERAYQAAAAQAGAVALLDDEVLPAAEASVRLLTEGWRAGKFDLFRVLQTSRDASEARRLYLETLGALWDASIALERAVGER
ncbi:MAG TPA: TolC family protein [Polyangia bacterium]|nr:TolC family protein [Polyangia bacterium]